MKALLSLVELLVIAILGGQWLYHWSTAQVGDLAVDARPLPRSHALRAPQEPRGP